jgi:hypothetical protein
MLSQLSNLFSSCWSPQTDDEHEAPRGPLDKPSGMTMDKGTSGTPKDVIDRMITLYHVSSDTGWAQDIADGKTAKTPLDKLKNPIDPERGKKLRKQDPSSDGRGGDDLGPGFYTGSSPEFVDYYTKDHSDSGRSSVLQFQILESALAKLKRRDIAPDDEQGFKKSMRDGFCTANGKTGELSLPALDQGAPSHDLVTGPINDIDKAKQLGVQTDGDTQYSPGSILKLGDLTPLQYTFATQEGVEALYDNSNITNLSIKDWRAMREKQKQGQK